jgi:hypothetical protein
MRAPAGHWRSPAVAALALLAAACASGPDVCKRDPITGSERCQPASGDYGEAAATVGIASAAWAVAGCTVNGCEPPYRCNGETKMCERIPCGEAKDSCPPMYHCDAEDNLCK